MRNEADEIAKYVSYDQETGRFTWVQQSSPRGRVGAFAGTVHTTQQRRYVTIRGRKYACARLAWLFSYGDWPITEVDHRDGDKLNDRIGNLRDVCARVNSENLRQAKSNNKAGALGVRQHRERFEARITAFGIEYALGSYLTPLR